jgi:hypothetical protein
MTAPSGQAALDNARQWSSYPPGYCLKFCRAEAWRIGGLYGSAIDAWHGAVHRHPGDRNPPVGAPMFYSGGTYGHIVVCGDDPGDDDIRGTDMPKSGQVSDGDMDWPVTNWGQTYLGWTEDLNGVDLPLGKDDDDMTEDDWKKLRGIVADEVAKNNGEAAERFWTDNLKVTKPDGTDETKPARQVIRETWQRVAKGL